jgi:predicted deacylase
MQKNDTLIATDIDFERDGVQTGTLRLPYSHNRSAYGHIPIPVMVAKRSDGPTFLFSGANHGDEYEGPLALMALARNLPLDRLNGRIIIIPALNMPAYRAGTRVSPIDQVNLNRAFPGDRSGTPTMILAHYVETVLMPLADYAMDFHSGGSSLDYLPTLFVSAAPPPAKARVARDDLVAAFGSPRVATGGMTNDDRVISSAARRNEVTFLFGEFGGAARVSREALAIVKNGIAGILDATGILRRSGPAPAPRPARRLRIDPKTHFIYAPRGGIFEPHFELGDEVAAGQLAGVIHDPVDPWKAPVEVTWKGSGLAICTRTLALCEAGDCLGHLAGDVD